MNVIVMGLGWWGVFCICFLCSFLSLVFALLCSVCVTLVNCLFIRFPSNFEFISVSILPSLCSLLCLQGTYVICIMFHFVTVRCVIQLALLPVSL